MKEFILKYFREILILVFGVIISVFLYKLYFISTDNSELIKFKLETLDKEINELYNQRKSLDSSINARNNKRKYVIFCKAIIFLASMRVKLTSFSLL